MPVSTFIMVDLPDPFGPISPWMVPRFTSRSTRSSARKPPNCMTAWLTRSRLSEPSPALAFTSAASASPCALMTAWVRTQSGRTALTNSLRKPTMPSGR